MRNDFPGLVGYYTPYWLELPLDQQPGDAQHQLMAKHYLKIIVQALKEYDNSLTETQYKAIAWTGLRGKGIIDKDTGLPINPTVDWKNTPLAERLLLNKTYLDFLANNPNCQE